MISDLELVRACQATYGAPPTLPVPMTGVDCRLTPASDGAAIVAFRGSDSIEDWVRDFLCLPIVDREHPQLGLCHAGFLDAAESVAPAVRAAIGDRAYYITGHSLGGAVAQGVGAHLFCAARPPAAIVTFGAPRFGMQKFVDLLAPIAVRLYRRGNDIVPLVPFDAPPLIRFLDARSPLIQIGVAQRDFLACHHIAGYVADVDAFLRRTASAV